MDSCFNMTFLASRYPPRQDVLSVTSVVSSCPAQTRSHQNVLLQPESVMLFSLTVLIWYRWYFTDCV